MRAFAGVVMLAALLASSAAGVEPRLPPLPKGWPAALHLGLTDAPGGAAALRRSVPLRFRYQYLAGGVGTGKGWATWNEDGTFVSRYVAESRSAGVVPVFTYYMLLHSQQQGGEAASDLRNVRDHELMRLYREDLEFFRRARGPTRAVLHVEPDFWGYAQQASRNDDARTVPGVVELARMVVSLRNELAPNVLLAYHLSGWGTKIDITYSKPPPRRVDPLARRAARFYRSLGVQFDVVFTDWADRDAGFRQHVLGDGGRSWWRPPDFLRHRRFLGTFVRAAGRRVVVWQIPLGNTRMRAMDNTWGHYQDNRVEWIVDRRHLIGYARAGVIAFLFGGGADGTTCACDARRDGVTDPPPINGNARPSLSADDDGGLFRERARLYYRLGPVPLPR